MMLIAHADWREMLSFNISKRADFGMRDANELAVPCLIYLLGLFVFIPRMLCQFTHRWFWVWLMTWSILCYVFSYALLASQSRQAWLALGVILPFVVTIRYYVWFTQNPTATRKAGWLILPIVLVIVLIAGNQNFLCQRLTTERIDVMHTVLNKDAQADTNTSVGARLNMFKFGIDKWLERPILGWGIGSTQYLTKSTHDKRVWASDPFDPLIGDHGYYANLHNIYAEILLRTGIIGALGWLTIVLAVYWALWQEYRLGNVQMDVFLYVVGLGAAICILGWFSFHVGNNRSCAYWLLLMGTAYSFRLRRAFSYEKI
jgi:O-antigen ligase